MRQINLSKSTKMFKIPQTQKRKREFFPTRFWQLFYRPWLNAYRAKR